MTKFKMLMAAVLVAGLCGSLVQAGDVPAVQGKPVWYVADRGFSPPRGVNIGETYTFWIKVKNDSEELIWSRVTIKDYPARDELLSAGVREIRVAPHGSATFYFRFHCGELGGKIIYKVEPFNPNK